MDYRKLYDEMTARKADFGVYDPRLYYTDGEPDITKLEAAGKLHLVQSVVAGPGGKVEFIKLANDYVGYVYVMRSDVGLFKIGRTGDVDKRLSQITNHSPVPIELLHARLVRDSRELESWLHARFSALREHGEWFRLTTADMEAAVELIDGYE